MDKRILKLLKKKRKYDLDTYTILLPNRKTSKIIISFLILFMLTSIIFFMDMFGIIDIGFNFILYFLTFLLFVAFPLSTITDSRKEYLMITPELLIRRTDPKVYEIINFNEVKTFQANDEIMLLTDKKDSVEVGFQKYERYIPIIVDILESKGKTFDKDKNFMVRPIVIICDGNTVKVEDEKIEKTKEEKIVYKLVDKYPVITPGYIEHVMPKHSVIQSVYLNDNSLYFELSHLEINSEHPENTTFGVIQVVNCIMIFVDVEITHLSKKAGTERKTPYMDIDSSLNAFLEEVNSGVVFEWKFSKKDADLIFSISSGRLQSSFSFKNSIVGWQEEKNSI